MWHHRMIVVLALAIPFFAGCDDSDRLHPRQDDMQIPADQNVASIHMFGDSIFRHYQGVEGQLESLIRRPIDNHATNGYRLNDIKNQYLALRQPGIDTVIMDGVGNDILGGRERCADDLTPSCRDILSNALDHLRELFDHFAADNVRAVYYTSYFSPEPGRWTSDTYRYAYRGSYTKAVDFAAEQAAALCAAAPVPCEFVDIRAVARERQPYTDDGIHPNWPTIDSIAQKISSALQTRATERP